MSAKDKYEMFEIRVWPSDGGVTIGQPDFLGDPYEDVTITMSPEQARIVARWINEICDEIEGDG